MKIRPHTFIPPAVAVFPIFVFAQTAAPVPSAAYIALIASHVVLGLIGIAALYAAAMALLKKVPNIRFVKWSSLIAALSFIASWAVGGIYYVFYYGGPVKATIKAGENPWAHTFFMEAKEHVFLLLPFITTTLFVVAWKAGGRVAAQSGFRLTLFGLAFLGVAIGVFITLAGVIISGSA